MNMKQYLPVGYFLSAKQVQDITAQAFCVLEKTGIAIADAKIRGKLEAAGMPVDAENRLFIAQKESIAFLEQLRREAFLEEQDIQRKMSRNRLEGCLCSYTRKYRDLYSGEIKLFDEESLIRSTQFCEKAARKYGGFEAFAPGYTTADPVLESLLKYKISAQHATGPLPIEPSSSLAAKHMFRMAEVMDQPIRRLPVYTISPLTLGGDSTRLVLENCQYLDSFYVFPMPAAGCTAPLSITEALVMMLAEILGAGYVVHKLTGLRCCLRPNVDPFDFSGLKFAFGTPQKYILERISEDFTAQLLNLSPNNHSVNIHTNRHFSDQEAAAEKMMLMTAGVLHGATKFYCIGSLALDELFSPVELLIDCTRIQRLEGLVRDIPLLSVACAAENINDALEDGFMADDFTMSNYRQYLDYDIPLHTAEERDYDRAVLEAARKLDKMDPVYRLDSIRYEELEKIYRYAKEEHQ